MKIVCNKTYLNASLTQKILYFLLQYSYKRYEGSEVRNRRKLVCVNKLGLISTEANLICGETTFKETARNFLQSKLKARKKPEYHNKKVFLSSDLKTTLIGFLLILPIYHIMVNQRKTLIARYRGF